MITVKLPREVDEKLTLLSLKTGRSRLFYAREAIIRNIELLEEKFSEPEGTHSSYADKKEEDCQDNEDLDFDL